MKRVLTLLLALLMLLPVSLPALAEDTDPANAVHAADSARAIEATAEAANIKKYGNVVLSVKRDVLMDAGFTYGDVLDVSFLDRTLMLPLCSNYSDVDSGTPAVFARTEDVYVELAINMGDFATTYGIAVKTTYEDKTFSWDYAEGVEGPLTVTISMKEPGGYYDEYVMHQLSYTNERGDYPDLTDAQFANFRAVATRGMGAGVLYRTASPVNPERGRNTYADAAIRAAGVTVVMNLADDPETVRGYEGYAESYYATTAYIALNMGIDFAAEDFQMKLAEGLRFFAEHPGVYAVHCTEGKDRAGFVTALLECLMGASCDEVIADYMVTYFNYYGVTKDDARYETIANSNIVKSLQRAFGVDDLQSADLAALAGTYLLGIGLTDAELAALRTNLSADGSQASLPFTDVAMGAWYAGAVDYVYERGWMYGTGETVFSPDAALTRGQLVTVLWRLAEQPEVDCGMSFTDVPGEMWYTEAVRWAAAEELIDGQPGNRFEPDTALTREEAVTLLWNYAKDAGADLGVGEDTNILSFGDAFAVSDDAIPAMQWAVGAGVLRGTPAGKLEPTGTLTRAQAAALFMRLNAESTAKKNYWEVVH